MASARINSSDYFNGFSKSLALGVEVEADFQTFADQYPTFEKLDDFPKAPIWFCLERERYLRGVGKPPQLPQRLHSGNLSP